MWRGGVHRLTKVARYYQLANEKVRKYLLYLPPDNFINEQRRDIAPPSCPKPPNTLTDEC